MRFLAVLVFLVVIAVSSNAFACCAGPTPQSVKETYEAAENIAVVEIQKKSSVKFKGNDYITSVYAVRKLENIKGNLPDTFQIGQDFDAFLSTGRSLEKAKNGDVLMASFKLDAQGFYRLDGICTYANLEQKLGDRSKKYQNLKNKEK